MNLEEEIKKSVELLKKGKIILYPTDTIWGIGCDATNSKAVQRIYKLKGRNETKSMIILLETVAKIERYVDNVPPVAYDLIANSASPLTIVYPRAKNLAKNLIASDGSIAIRIVKGRFGAPVMKALDKPLVSTSANVSGQPTAALFHQISEEIIENVDYAVEAFRERVRAVKPSTIIKLEENGKFTVLRP
ncbi:MAG: L-threonylcarbamoyladenylate synthase [Bacteroidales bacterium]|jgi:L-threonylcarbamoyladenylate synthase|nr:L-threonylcarbamoyladenylate synthase [Bacteroidales bacterium]